MKIVIDTKADKHVRLKVLNNSDDWLTLVRELSVRGERPTSFMGPMVYPALAMLGTFPLGDIRFSSHEISIEFAYNFEVLPEPADLKKAA